MKHAIEEIYSVKKTRSNGAPVDLRKLSIDPGIQGHLLLGVKTMPNGHTIKSLDLVHPGVTSGASPGTLLGTLLKPELTQLKFGKMVFCGLEQQGRAQLVLQEWECTRLPQTIECKPATRTLA